MKNRKRILIYKTLLCCTLSVLLLCGCARREPQADGLDELLLTMDETPEQGSQPGGDLSAQSGGSEVYGAGQSTDMAGAVDQGNMTDMSDCADCYVYICGAVKEPGVYRMDRDDRIYAVIERAGGFSESACQDYVNQALKVVDGLKIWIPTVEEAKKEASGEAVSAAGSGGLTYSAQPEEHSPDRQPENGLVNINTAGEEQLCTLTGIGKAKAQAIIAYRMEHGNFARPEDIMNVTGIKQSGFEKIKDGICVN